MALSTSGKTQVELKSRSEIESMKRAGRIAGLTLKEIGAQIQPGMTTRELDALAEEFIRKSGAIPTFVGYRGYPATICVSINEEVVHGIPGKRILKKGDVVSVDVAATVDGFVGDNAMTYAMEPIPPEARKLIEITKKSLTMAIDQMRPGKRLGDIGAAVQNLVEPEGYGVVRDFVGHGIGRQMHENPAVPNYGKAGTGLRLEPGLVLAIEPMITLGDWHVKILEDSWTVVTQDKSLAAHFEHTIAVTEEEPLILTKVD